MDTLALMKDSTFGEELMGLEEEQKEDGRMGEAAADENNEQKDEECIPSSMSE